MSTMSGLLAWDLNMRREKWFIFIVRHAAGIWISKRDIDILLLQRKKKSRMCSSYILIAIDDKATGVEFDFENRENY